MCNAKLILSQNAFNKKNVIDVQYSFFYNLRTHNVQICTDMIIIEINDFVLDTWVDFCVIWYFKSYRMRRKVTKNLTQLCKFVLIRHIQIIHNRIVESDRLELVI